MSWVLSLARSGGTAGSHGGHETRRHRVRGPFPMGACLLLAGTLALAGCGSSSNSTLTINQQQSEPEPEPQTGGGSGEGEGDGGQGAGGGTPPTDTTTTEDGDGDTDSGDTTTTDDGGQTSTQQPPPQTGGGSGGNQGSGNQGSGGSGGGTGGGGSSDSGIVNNPPPNNNPPVVSSLPRSGGAPEPREIENCNGCANGLYRTSVIAGISYFLQSNFNDVDNSYAPLKGKDRYIKADIIGRNDVFNPSHGSYNFAYNKVSRKNTEVTYTKQDGFVGAYSYKGESQFIEEDVTLKVAFKNIVHKSYRIQGYIGDSNGIIMEGTNFGKIKFSAYGLPEDGQFIDKDIRFSNMLISTETGFNELRGSFKSDGSSTSFPTQVVGELEMKRFFDTSPIRNNKPLEYNDNLFKRGDNALAGVFVADKSNEEVTLYNHARVHDEGKLSMLYYGIWANENFTDNRIVFLEQTTRFDPARTASDYTAHTTTNNTVFYRRKDGFKGVYIYEGETGKLTGDVDLIVDFRSNEMLLTGTISTDLDIGIETEEGYPFGIAVANGTINLNTGVGDIDIDADGYDDRRPATKFTLGIYDNIKGIIFPRIENKAAGSKNMDNQGHTRKLRMALSPDGIQAQGSTPESYPSQIAGEVEINGFKIYSDDGDNNTIVGVFVGDKQE